MRLGYPVRFARYAFLIGLIAYVLSWVIVFSLNVVTLRTENVQMKLTTRLRSHEELPSEPDEEPSPAPPQNPAPPPSPTPSPSPAPYQSDRQINQVAARRTIRMLQPMLYYLGSTGFLWALTSWRKLS